MTNAIEVQGPAKYYLSGVLFLIPSVWMHHRGWHLGY